MADIDFSDLPTESSINMRSWFKAFGIVKAVVILVFILGFGILANIYTTPAVQTTALIMDVVIILWAGYAVVNFNKGREFETIQKFAAANNFEFQPMATMVRTDLPKNIASKFTAKTVKIYYRLSGVAGKQDFELFHVRGLYYTVGTRTYVDITVLEVDGASGVSVRNKNIRAEATDSGVRAMLWGNALSRQDMSDLFTAAGIS